VLHQLLLALNVPAYLVEIPVDDIGLCRCSVSLGVSVSNLLLIFLGLDMIDDEEAHLLVLFIGKLKTLLGGFGTFFLSLHNFLCFLYHRLVLFIQIDIRLIHPDDALTWHCHRSPFNCCTNKGL